MPTELKFESRAAFRAWLTTNAQTSPGVWLLFGKPGGPVTLTAQEALEEALAHGWIDGQMRRIDDTTYAKYFAQRRPTSVWSQRNMDLIEQLEAKGIMAEPGRAKVREAKAAGLYVARVRPTATPELLTAFRQAIADVEPAYTNFQAMSPSVQGTYTMYWQEPKSDAAREKRLAKIIDRLNQNLKPM